MRLYYYDKRRLFNPIGLVEKQLRIHASLGTYMYIATTVTRHIMHACTIRQLTLPTDMNKLSAAGLIYIGGNVPVFKSLGCYIAAKSH